MKSWAKVIATFFYAGYAPKAPGTFGALGAVLFLYLLDFFGILSDPLIFFLVVVFYLAGVWSSNVLEKDWGKDPSKIVVDEAVGLWIAILFIPFSHLNILLAFILFRFFDIVKPLGIRKMENFKSGHGVMMDDVLAGIYSNLVLQIFNFWYQGMI